MIFRIATKNDGWLYIGALTRKDADKKLAGFRTSWPRRAEELKLALGLDVASWPNYASTVACMPKQCKYLVLGATGVSLFVAPAHPLRGRPDSLGVHSELDYVNGRDGLLNATAYELLKGKHRDAITDWCNSAKFEFAMQLLAYCQRNAVTVPAALGARLQREKDAALASLRAAAPTIEDDIF